MSDDQRPPRRRIAGESGPASGPTPPARRVVKKPVARPGVTPVTPPAPETSADEQDTPPKTSATAKTAKKAAATKTSATAKKATVTKKSTAATKAPAAKKATATKKPTAAKKAPAAKKAATTKKSAAAQQAPATAKASTSRARPDAAPGPADHEDAADVVGDAAGEAVETTDTEQRSAPRIVPAGRRGRKRTAPQPPPADAEDDSVTPVTARTPDATDDASDATTESAPRRASGGRRALLTRVLTAVVVVVALGFGAGASYWAWERAQGAFGLETARGEAAQAAAAAAEQVLSYRFDELDEHLEDSQALMTPSFAEDFESISPALDDLAPQRRIQVEATARNAAAQPCGNDCSTDSAEVLVFVDQARLADGEEQPTVFGNRITLSMVQDDGEWLVDDIEAY